MIKIDYCRGKPNVSSRGLTRLWITAATFVAAAIFATLPSRAQYPGQITNANKDVPNLRAVAVLEWTGDADHPKASRLVPVSVYDGQVLQDAGLYLARPEPLALEGEVEYQLQLDGKPVGLFQVENSGREQGSWVGYGKLKPIPRPRPAPVQVAKIDEDDAQSDEPVLHRKHHAGDSGGGSGSDSGSGSNGAPPDPDRPTLHKGGDTSSDSSASPSTTGSSQPSDPNRPTLHKSPDASSSGSGDSGTTSSDSGSAPDPDRPTLHRGADSSSSTSASNSDNPKLKKKKDEDEAYVEDVATETDPDRPHLNRGKSAGVGLAVLPSLMGLPPEMQQEVAVSDVKNRPVHPWDYSWASPDDEAKMRSAMEDLARTALGLNPPAAPATPAKRTATTARKPAKPTPPPAPLLDEQFRVFELAYGSGATMVLTAHTDASEPSGKGSPEKFVTLIGQPDLYGNVSMLVKNVTDAAHLDDTPHMRLVDAVDAMADNRGELLFELRGQTQRQFALYRVLRGSATRIFVSGADAVGTPAGN
jgi:hypothetical protein